VSQTITSASPAKKKKRGAAPSSFRYLIFVRYLTFVQWPDWWLGPAVHQAKWEYVNAGNRAENDFAIVRANARVDAVALHRRRDLKRIAPQVVAIQLDQVEGI
jgi:hypothetical protein